MCITCWLRALAAYGLRRTAVLFVPEALCPTSKWRYLFVEPAEYIRAVQPLFPSLGHMLQRAVEAHSAEFGFTPAR